MRQAFSRAQSLNRTLLTQTQTYNIRTISSSSALFGTAIKQRTAPPLFNHVPAPLLSCPTVELPVHTLSPTAPILTQTQKKLEIDARVLCAPMRRDVLLRAVLMYQGSKRETPPPAKTRGDVIGTTRKPHPQKGTGRARQGDKRGPHMIKGGTAHGPTLTRDWNVGMDKKVRKLALRVALSVKHQQGNLWILDTIPQGITKTRQVVEMIQEILNAEKDLFDSSNSKHSENSENSKNKAAQQEKEPSRLLFCATEEEWNSESGVGWLRAGKNVVDFSTVRAEQVNVHDLIKYGKIVVTLAAMKDLETRGLDKTAF